MLKFIDENDFLLVENYKENEHGSVDWVYQNHSGFIREGMTRQHEVQTGTETIVTGTESVLDDDGNPMLADNGEPVTQDVTEEQPVFETQTIDVWGTLQAKIQSGEITVEPFDTSIVTERLAEQARSERNRLLAESDFTQLADSPQSGSEWQNYRQELRDITAQEGFPHDVIWPKKPE